MPRLEAPADGGADDAVEVAAHPVIHLNRVFGLGLHLQHLPEEHLALDDRAPARHRVRRFPPLGQLLGLGHARELPHVPLTGRKEPDAERPVGGVLVIRPEDVFRVALHLVVHLVHVLPAGRRPVGKRALEAGVFDLQSLPPNVVEPDRAAGARVGGDAEVEVDLRVSPCLERQRVRVPPVRRVTRFDRGVLGLRFPSGEAFLEAAVGQQAVLGLPRL